MTQLTLAPIVAQAAREQRRLLDMFMARHREEYVQYAQAIVPDLTRWQDVWDRMAFAILTAQTEVPNAVRAFTAARQRRGFLWLRGHRGITPDRVTYVNSLPCGPTLRDWLRHRGEDWHMYRLRVNASVMGLGLTKASYAVTLLYPLTAQVACVDTWIQKLFVPGTRAFQDLTIDQYLAVEAQLRGYARRHRVTLGLAQWMAWDFVRGTTTPQRFFD